MKFTLHDSVSDASFDLYGVGALSFKAETGDNDPIVLISLPKAGTYLLAAILEELGCVDTEVHLSEMSFTDYRGLTAAQKREPADARNRWLPINISAGLIGRGQFAVGHLGHSEHTRTALAKHKKVFIYRDLRACVASYVRFAARTGRDNCRAQTWGNMEYGGAQLAEFLKVKGEPFLNRFCGPVVEWRGDAQAYPIAFETLLGDDGSELRFERVRKMCDHLSLSATDAQIEQAIAATLGKDTKTFSGARTDLLDCWNAEVEQIFRGCNGHALNQRLGLD